MLGHPRGGALAVVAHVDRAWSYSFMAPGLGSHTTAFESTLDQLLEGYPVGAAMEFFSDRYAEISTVLASLLEDLEYPDIEVDPWDVADNWTANNDARGYLILGDPAARLAAAAPGEEARERPAIEVAAMVSTTAVLPASALPASAAAPPGHEALEAAGGDHRVAGVVDVTEAGAELARLLERVDAGEEIVLTRGGRRVARLVPDVEPREKSR